MIEALLSSGPGMNIKSIQTFTVGPGTPNSAYVDLSINPVDPERTFIITNSVIYASSISTRIAVDFIDESTIRVYNRISGVASWALSSIKLVELSSPAKVSRGKVMLNFSPPNIPADTVVNIPTIKPDKSISICSFRNLSTSGADGRANDAVHVLSSSTLTISQVNPSGSPQMQAFWQVVEF